MGSDRRRQQKAYLAALPLLGAKSAEDIIRHLNWWKAKIGKYTLNHINSDLIKKQRQELLDEVSPRELTPVGGTSTLGKQRGCAP